MNKKIPSVGDRVDARCTKCRKILNHTIVAMVEDRPARVLCNTCGGEHNYRAPTVTGGKTKTTTTKKAATKKNVEDKKHLSKADRQQWENIQSEMDTSKAVPYTMDGIFSVGALIEHPVFGLGLVEEKAGTDKIRVLFEDSKKVLRCAQTH